VHPLPPIIAGSRGYTVLLYGMWYDILLRVFPHLAISATFVTVIDASFHAIRALHYILNTQLYALDATQGMLHSNVAARTLRSV